MSDNCDFSPYEGHKERRTGKIRGDFSRMHRALDSWMLARAPASPAQGLPHHWTAGCWLARRLRQLKASTTMDLGISIFLISVQCVALRNLDLLIKPGWSVIFSFFC